MSGADAAGGIFTIVFVLFMSLVGLVVTVVSVALPLGIVWFVFKKLGEAQAAEKHLRDNGIPARAVVTSLAETGLRVNDRPQVRIGLRVHPTAGEPYDASVQRIVSILEIPRIQPGTEVTVKVDPTNPMVMALDLAAAVPEATRECGYCHARMPASARTCPSCGASS